MCRDNTVGLVQRLIFNLFYLTFLLIRFRFKKMEIRAVSLKFVCISPSFYDMVANKFLSQIWF